MASDTGNGATVALTTDGFNASVINVSLGGETLEMLDNSHLGTTGNMAKLAADLVDQKPVTVEYFVDPTDSNKYAPAVGPDEKDTLTVTFALQDGSTAATWVASGHVTDTSEPQLANNQLMQGSFEFTPDGVTGPTFTAEV